MPLDKSGINPCPGCGEDLNYVVEGIRYTRATSVEIPGVYDGGLFNAHTRQSGGCGYAWPRWTKASPRLYDLAMKYIEQWNAREYDDDRK